MSEQRACVIRQEVVRELATAPLLDTPLGCLGGLALGAGSLGGNAGVEGAVKRGEILRARCRRCFRGGRFSAPAGRPAVLARAAGRMRCRGHAVSPRGVACAPVRGGP